MRRLLSAGERVMRIRYYQRYRFRVSSHAAHMHFTLVVSALTLHLHANFISPSGGRARRPSVSYLSDKYRVVCMLIEPRCVIAQSAAVINYSCQRRKPIRIYCMQRMCIIVGDECTRDTRENCRRDYLAGVA